MTAAARRRPGLPSLLDRGRVGGRDGDAEVPYPSEDGSAAEPTAPPTPSTRRIAAGVPGHGLIAALLADRLPAMRSRGMAIGPRIGKRR